MSRRIFPALLYAGLLAIAPAGVLSGTPTGGVISQTVLAADGNAVTTGVIEDFADLKAANNTGKVYDVKAEVEITEDITLTNVTLNFLPISEDEYYYSCFYAVTDAELTIGNGAVLKSADKELDANVGAKNGGTLVINSGARLDGVFAYITNNGFMVMNGGVITGSNYGGVYLGSGSTFYMTGGTISDNTAEAGGGVSVWESSFLMSGGTISDNTADGGGGVSVWEGSFLMSGGTISGNTAYMGGGVAVNGTFTMTGGSILNNQAIVDLEVEGSGVGGGVCLMSTEWVDELTSFEMTGGTIAGNNALSGSGIYVANFNGGPSYVTLSGSTLSVQDCVNIAAFEENDSYDEILNVTDLNNSPSDPVYIEIPAEWFNKVRPMSLFLDDPDSEFINHRVAVLLNGLIETITSENLHQFRFVITKNGKPAYYPVVEYEKLYEDAESEKVWLFKWSETSPRDFAYTVDYAPLVSLCADIHGKLDELGYNDIPAVLAAAFEEIDWNLEDNEEGKAELNRIIALIRDAYNRWLASLNPAEPEEEPAEEEPVLDIPSEPLNGWKYYASGTMYYVNGVRTRGLAEIDGENYYFDEKGFLQTGWVELEDGWRHFDEEGVRDTGWLQEGNVWYYLDPETGLMYHDGLSTVGKSVYYFYDWGGMASDWWYEDEAGDWYFFGGSGAMRSVQWTLWKGEWYYLTETGKMAADAVIGGYYVNADGVWVE